MQMRGSAGDGRLVGSEGRRWCRYEGDSADDRRLLVEEDGGSADARETAPVTGDRSNR